MCVQIMVRTFHKRIRTIVVFGWVMICMNIVSKAQQPLSSKIDLSGKWNFQIDSMDRGIDQHWFSNKLKDQVSLPGSMLTNGKGNEVTVDTKWTGDIWDSTWYKSPEFAKYRQPG